MKKNSILLILIFLFTTQIFSQSHDETNVIAKGCKKIKDNLELKHCFNDKLSFEFSRKLSKRLLKEFNPGINKFNIGIVVQPDTSIELVCLNSDNLIIRNEFKKRLDKIKILEPGIVDGKPVAVNFEIPIVFIKKEEGVKAIHKLSRIVDKNDYNGNENIFPTITDYKCNYKDNFKCFRDYIINYFYNSIESKQIAPLLNKGMSSFEIKVLYGADNNIKEVISDSGKPKLDSIFEKNINSILKKSNFLSPTISGVSYAGEMVLYIFYSKT